MEDGPDNVQFFVFCLLSGNVDIEQCFDKDNVHAEIQPDHQKNKRGQASVQREGTAIFVNVKGVEIGKNHPEKCRQYSSRKLGKKCRLVAWKKAVHQHKKQIHEYEIKGRAQDNSGADN